MSVCFLMLDHKAGWLPDRLAFIFVGVCVRKVFVCFPLPTMIGGLYFPPKEDVCYSLGVEGLEAGEASYDTRK